MSAARRSRRKARPNAASRGMGAAAMGVVMAVSSAGIANVKTGRPVQPAAVEATSVGASARGRGGAVLPAVLVLPDPVLHPGVATEMTQAQVCADSFHTDSVRPPTSYTNKLKALMLSEDGGDVVAPSGTRYHVTGEGLPGVVGDYELDHLIPLDMGGNPEDPANLWMQPWEKKGRALAAAGQGAESKDVLEGRLHRKVCQAGEPLDQAQQDIASDWRSAL